MIRPRLLLLLAFALPLPRSEAQELPFTVTTIDWQPDVRERQRRAYRSEAGEREVLYCVESFVREATSAANERIVITAVRRDEPGRAHRIANVGERCLDAKGLPLPMFHTHSDGNCQFSPADLVTLVARGAPFEGIQCGERHFVWSFAWQILAVATSVERERLARGGRNP